MLGGLHHKKMLRRGLTGMLLCGTVFSFAGCATPQAEEPLVIVEAGNEEVSYKFVTCIRDDVALTKLVRCTYKKNEEENIYFPVSGKLVDKVYVQKGDPVKKGDLLVELSTGNLEQEIRNLEYQIKRNELLLGYIDEEEDLDMQNIWLDFIYNSAHSEWDNENLTNRLDNLYTNNDYQRENYGDSLEFDKKELAALKKELSQSRIYASMDGTIFSVSDNLEGSTSNVENVAMVLVDNSEGYFEVKGTELKDCFEEGKTVPLSITAGTAKGTYELIPSHMDQWTDTLTFTILSGDNVGNIEAGTGGNLIVTLDSRENVLSVPAGCVHQADEAYYVYVLNEDNVREVRWIEVGLYGDEKVEILSGLDEGDKVIRR